MPQIAVVILLFTIVGLVGVRTTLKGFKQFRREGGLGQLCGPKRPEVGRRQPTAFSDISNHRFDQLCPKYSHKLSRAPFFFKPSRFCFSLRAHFFLLSFTYLQRGIAAGRHVELPLCLEQTSPVPVGGS
jgi:hypothetical protein